MEINNFLDVAYDLINKNKSNKNNILIAYYIKVNSSDKINEEYDYIFDISEEVIDVFKTVTIEEIFRRLSGNKTERLFVS